MSPAPTKTGSLAGSGVGVALGRSVGASVGAAVAVGGVLGRAVGVSTANSVAVGRQALGVVASGCPQPAVAITSAIIENLANERRVLICLARIMIPCERIRAHETLPY